MGLQWFPYGKVNQLKTQIFYQESLVRLCYFTDHLLLYVIPILTDDLLCLQLHTVGSVLFFLSIPPPTHTILRFSCDFPLNAALQFLWLRYEVALTVLQMGNCEMQILKQADSQSRFLTYLWFKMMLLVF